MSEYDFAEPLPESASSEELDRITPALLRYLLTSGNKGYGDGIDRFDPQPSQNNNWLYSDGEFKGRFVDERPQGDRVLEFTISRQGSEWVKTFKPVSGVED